MSTKAQQVQKEELTTGESELPVGWASTNLGQCVDILDGQRVPINSEERKKRIGNVPYYGATGQVGWIDNFLFNEELLLLGEDGAPFLDKSKPIGYLITGKSWVNNHAHVLRAIKGLTTNKFLKYFLDVFDFSEYVAGSTRLKLTQAAMNTIPVSLAPLVEQKRMVSKIEAIDSELGKVKKRLDRASALLKNFRHSVLEAACSGKLTEDWRKDSFDGEDLPSGWCWSFLGEILPKGGIFDGPFGSNLKTSDYVNSGIRVVRLENIGRLEFIHSKQVFISEEKYRSLERHSVFEGDVLFASFIEDEIRTCVLPKLHTKAIAKADCFCLRPDPKKIDSSYLSLQLASAESYNSLLEEIHGATRPRVNTTQLKKLSVRVCPLAEQREIVRRAEALFRLADAIEKRVAAAALRSQRLTQAVLAKAFRGQLVPTEAGLARREGREYEPASVLLERIKAERTAASPARKTKKKRAATV